MDDATVRIAAGLRLGARLVARHPCICGAHVEEDGLHGLSCRRSAGRSARHNNVNDIIQRAFKSAGIAAVREPPGLMRQDNKRPDGMTLIPWKRGRSLIWDFTCPDSFAPSHMDKTSLEAGAAAEEAATRKHTKYAYLSLNYDFVPVAVETMGSINMEGRQFIKELGHKIEESRNEPRSTEFLRQQISIAIQRGNAASIMGTHRQMMDTIGEEAEDF